MKPGSKINTDLITLVRPLIGRIADVSVYDDEVDDFVDVTVRVTEATSSGAILTVVPEGTKE